MWDNHLIYKLIRPTDRVLDLGCGNKDSFNGIVCNYTGVDVFSGALYDVKHDLSSFPYPFEDNSYDIVTALDFIEHLDKDVGRRMLEEAHRIAKKRIIIFTPDEFRDNRVNIDKPGLWSTGNEWNLHKSLWTKDDFENWNFLDYTDPGYIFCYKDIT